MIKIKSDLQFYIEQDSLANKFTENKGLKAILFPNPIWKFLLFLRKAEYYSGKKGGGKLFYLFYKMKLRKYSLKLGYSIPEHVFGPGLALPHYGTIVVNANAKVGANCRIHACTNIGASGGTNKAPQIGNNVYIGPGAKIYGDIVIGNNNAIAANAAVNKSFLEEGIVIGGVPAKIIGKIEVENIIKHI